MLPTEQALSPDELKDRFRGVLLGLATGDALGGPVEFMNRYEIIQKRGKPVRDMIGGGTFKLAPGETTDDTAMARALAESLAARGAFDCDDVAQHYVAWIQTNPKDVGVTTRRSLEAWQKGVTVPNGAMGVHRLLGGRSAGNGTVMRCAPIALRFLYDERKLIDASRDDALITHFDAQAWTGSVAINMLITRLCRGHDIPTAIRDVAQHIAQLPKATVSVAQVLEKIAGDEDSRTLPTTGFVLDTLRIAVWSLLRSQDFEEAVVAAVNCGGDSDTQGAVSGALAGARWGYKAIPQRWLDVLWGRDELVGLADRLFEIAEATRVA
ncbi:MAG: ADP-ribosylglycohydrolase family protein [Herpetosiphon sp.]